MPAACRHPGHTDFNLADRLAIINLISTYAEPYDNNNIDQWFELFTDDPKVMGYMGANEPFSVSGQAFKDFFRGFLASSIDEAGIIPRHLVSNVRIREQAADQAEASAYVTYIPLHKEILPTPRTKEQTRITGTALYTFQVEKGQQDGAWRIREYTVRYDQGEV
ncbi:MAG: nuclear transport factor 2 family protein [Desulfuromonadales bacterium]|nr:nuclear transport factor 2 family protein [Desulfuromonadales bacterium]